MWEIIALIVGTFVIGLMLGDYLGVNRAEKIIKLFKELDDANELIKKKKG